MTTKNTTIIQAYNESISLTELDNRIEQKIREFKSVLILKGVKQADIGRKINVTRVTINRVLTGQDRSKYVESALKKYGIDMKELYTLQLLRGVFNEDN